ncbi:hypothetical protein jhhlp_005365 [Lomentospora prolificans]|uniref:Uncharacterized protein n=1 Tax=Lomentospora prolificans TaxID=41688 RepID=A0A2N3N6L5_9PEZI|nr:hypothetical protein jhhlp_005365 [Lomentospora prolificans]
MTTPQRIQFVRRLQTAMAVGYSSMGAWCLLHPASVISLSLSPTYAVYNATTGLLMRCFGAQAMTAGLLLGTAPMDERSFTCFGLAMVPYIFFNAWYGVGPGRGVFTKWLFMDFVGNIFFGLGSAYCVRLLREQGEEDKRSKAE